MSQEIVTRFAPSPTGFLHIGGARTALFNWLYARAKGGKMRLRIEDTDRERSSDEAISVILEGLSWLGLECDDEVVYQHANLERHQKIAEELLAKGHAYKCYCTPQEVQEMRERARAENRPPIYDGTCRNREDAPTDIAPAIRFKSPDAGETIIDDQVQGLVKFPNEALDDLILLRSNGGPTYMLSVVADDHDMGVSHIIRGDDHLTNAARQAQIYQALDWQLPVFAHIPLIHGQDGAKLSKRHGALGIEAYREMGFLPEALRNYLVRLGWSHGDDEIMSTEQMIEWFDIQDINKGAARFDFTKLEHVNAHYIKSKDDQALMNELLAFWERFGYENTIAIQADPLLKNRLATLMPAIKTRAKTLRELGEQAGFLFTKIPLQLDDKSKKMLNGDARAILKSLIPILQEIDDDSWRAQALETSIKEFVDKQGLKLGEIAQPLRAALTGTSKSPGIFDVLAALGKKEALLRIGEQLSD